MAEAIFNSLSKGKHTALSVGTKVGEHEGQKLKELESATNVLAVLREIGIDAENNVRTQLTPEILGKVDVVVSMSEQETIPEYLSNDGRVAYWKVMDPFRQSLEITRQIREQIAGLVQALLESLV